MTANLLRVFKSEAVSRRWISSFAAISIAFLLSCWPPRLAAQVGSAGLSGTITDPAGSVVPNATVTVQSAEQGSVRTATSGSQGEYVIPTLPPGSYQLSVKATGFVDYKTESFQLSSGQNAALNVTLVVSGQKEAITVQAAAPVLETTSASVGALVTARQMTDLPLLGRSFLNAVALVPGSVPVPPAGSTTNHSPVNQSVMPSVYGQRQKDNNFLVDGVENRDPNLLGVAIYPPPEAIAEMRVDSGVGSSAYGHGSGATIDVVTKSGGAQWHGDGWEYLRNNVLDARSFFTPTIGAYRWNQFGAAVGGPAVIPHLLRKDRGWYVFGYYEGVRVNGAANYTAYVPTAANYTGDLSNSTTAIYDPYSTAAGPNGTSVRDPFPGNIIPASRLNAQSVKLAQTIIPGPNLPTGLIPGTNYLNTSGTVTDGNQWSARADHQFSQRDQFFFRYSGADNPVRSASYPSIQQRTEDRLLNLVAGNTYTISPTFVVTGRYGLTGVYNLTGSSAPAGITQATGLADVFPKFLGSDFIPGIGIPGYSGITFNASDIGPLHQHSWIGDAQKIMGRHTLEFGGAVVYSSLTLEDTTSNNIQYATTQTSDFNSTSGNALASYLLGLPDSARRQIGRSLGILTSPAYGVYAQDTWRGQRLTVNLGLRYDYNSPPVNQYGLGGLDFDTGVYIWDRTNPITGAPANIRAGGITPDRNNLGPRLGLAYQITPRTVVRSSFGLFYNSFGSNYMQASQSERGNWPFAFPQAVSSLNATTPTAIFPDPFPGNPQGSPTPTICAQCLNVDQNSSRTPYVAEWSFTLQRQLTQSLAVEAAYFGSKASKLTAQIIDNTAVVAGPGPVANRQIYPQYAPYVLNGYNEFPAWYDGGSLRVDKRLSRGFSFLVSYTYSKNLDYVDNLSSGNVGGQPTSNPTRFSANKAVSGFDLRHVLVISATWQIPGRTGSRVLDAVVSGWGLSNIFTFHSGLPYSAFLGSDNENIGSVGGRSDEFPNLVGNPNAIANPSPNEWFNIAAFAIPQLYTVGNAGRNILRSDTLVDDDLSLSKSWTLAEHRSIELRGEFFNLFNHANFGFPGSIVGTSQFGTISSTLNSGRQVQVAAKIHF